jgi:hypothetical protein
MLGGMLLETWLQEVELWNFNDSIMTPLLCASLFDLLVMLSGLNSNFSLRLKGALAVGKYIITVPIIENEISDDVTGGEGTFQELA